MNWAVDFAIVAIVLATALGSFVWGGCGTNGTNQSSCGKNAKTD